jgi:hypothetical protein
MFFFTAMHAVLEHYDHFIVNQNFGSQFSVGQLSQSLPQYYLQKTDCHKLKTGSTFAVQYTRGQMANAAPARGSRLFDYFSQLGL